MELVKEFELPQGWELIESKAKKNCESGYYIVIAFKKFQYGMQYVTWEYNSCSRCYWGHYFYEPSEATVDFNKRVENE